MAKRPVSKYDFRAFGAAIKAARKERKESRKQVSDEMYISPRYLANIENKGQHPSLQIFYELVARYNISVDQFFFPDNEAEKSTQRLQLDTLLDNMSDAGLRIMAATAKEAVGHQLESGQGCPKSRCKPFLDGLQRLLGFKQITFSTTSETNCDTHILTPRNCQSSSFTLSPET